ncbi:holo-ACP synthase [Anaerosphaera aminiphila DSM 21120]|uniref:citrate lyase holo-[acyl-carrier protein] synthase n=1 Tax=Anaerosphaera aminiphila DSM 21120 TaxID=1120995 RepID=A0A1M5UUA2_9FIRM|nr:citrate lyase holo-[acyl-carrier protein] synthase [Anaerosphaera aminiphila]SHH66506.1 holo-ACP synthase [Anaerosphaera aminiphila DSM 21120]
MKVDIELRLQEMLKSKEERRNVQEDLIKKYNSTIISFMLNIPGEDKNNIKYEKFHKKYIAKIKDSLEKNSIEILSELYFNKQTGMEYFAAINSNALKIKKLMIELEESSGGGRVLDIDVFDRNFKQISRSELGYENRKCLICNNNAIECMRFSRHSLEDLIDRVNKLILEDK